MRFRVQVGVERVVKFLYLCTFFFEKFKVQNAPENAPEVLDSDGRSV